jgi:hypothetical protein
VTRIQARDSRAYEVANPDQVREGVTKQKRGKGMDIIAAIEERLLRMETRLNEERESLESEFEELKGEIIGSLNVWMNKKRLRRTACPK